MIVAYLTHCLHAAITNLQAGSYPARATTLLLIGEATIECRDGCSIGRAGARGMIGWVMIMGWCEKVSIAVVVLSHLPDVKVVCAFQAVLCGQTYP